jgi:hypothetical protein
MVARATRTSWADEACAQSWGLRSIAGAFDCWVWCSSAGALAHSLDRSSSVIKCTTRVLIASLAISTLLTAFRLHGLATYKNKLKH